MSGFHEVLFPTGISYGSNGGPGFKTSITTLPSGQEERVQLWSGGRNQYDVSKGIKQLSDLAEVMTFYRARSGATNGFRFKDFMDFHSSPTNPSHTGSTGTQDQEIGVGDGTETVFQLKKTYTSGATSVTRVIRKPVSGTVSVWVNSALQTEGVDYTVDTTTGEITFGTAPTSGHVIDASFEFDVPVRFGEDADRVLAASVDAYDTGSIPSIPLIEDLDPGGGYEHEHFYGGAKDLVITADVQLSIGEAFTYRISAASGLNVGLPAEETTPDGRPVFLIVNDGSNSFDVRDDSPATVVTLAAGEAAYLSVLEVTTGGTRNWFAV